MNPCTWSFSVVYNESNPPKVYILVLFNTSIA
jgi:hypothetical protein